MKILKNKKVLITGAFVLLAAAVFLVVILLKNRAEKKGGAEKEFSSLSEAVEYAGFSMEYSDRLSGYPASGFKGSSSSITVLYPNGGYIKKAFAAEEGTKDADPEESEHVISGVPVYFTESEGDVTKARWTDNGFDYIISIESGGESVTAEEMEDYVRMTR